MARRSRTTSPFSALPLVLLLVAVLCAVVAAAILFAPRKPAAPPPSEMRYAERPAEKPETRPAPVRDAAPEAAPAHEIDSMEGEPEAPPDVADNAAPMPFLLRGRVLDARTAQPVAGARVDATRQWTRAEQEDWMARNAEAVGARDKERMHALRQEERQLRVAYRDEAGVSGGFRIEAAMAGTYAIQVMAPGYMPEHIDSVTLGPGSEDEKLEVRLSQGARILGRVREAGSSRPAPGVRVLLETLSVPDAYAPHRPPPQRIETGADGDYVLSGLTPGEYGLTVDVSGTEYETEETLPYEKVSIGAVDEERRGVDFEVAAAGVVWGYVQTPDKEPIGGARVVLCSSESVLSQALNAMIREAPPISAASQEDGYYELLGVPLRKEWRVYASSANQSPQLADPFLLTPTSRSVRIDIFMFPGSDVSGRVVSSEGGPVEGASVMCIPTYSALASPMRGAQAFRTTQSDARGAFVLPDLPAGPHQLLARKDGFKLATVGESIYPNGYSEVKGVQLVLYPLGGGEHRVFGHVLSPRGEGIGGVELSLIGVSGDSLGPSQQSTTTASDGAFLFDGVELGVYRLEAYKEGYARKTLSQVAMDQENEIVLRAAGIVQGRVLVKETEAAPPSYTVAAVPLGAGGQIAVGADEWLSGSKKATFDSPDGSYELSLAPGLYRIEGSAPGLTPGKLEVMIEGGEVSTGMDLWLSEEGGLISGQVVTGGGKSPQGAVLRLVEAGSSSEALVAATLDLSGQPNETQVGSDGFFTFTNLAEGQYIILARHSDYAATQSEPIFLEANGTRTGVEIRLGQGGGLEGYVYVGGEAAPEVMVMVVGNGVSETASTDEEGYYSVDGLAAGAYQVLVSTFASEGLAGAYDTQTARVEVTEGQTVRQDFGGGEGVRIEGMCVPPPRSLLGGFALLRTPGPPPVSLGDIIGLSEMAGRSAAIDPGGVFFLDGVPPGEWQVDVFYVEFATEQPVGARYVHSELVNIEGTEEVIPLELSIQN